MDERYRGMEPISHEDCRLPLEPIREAMSGPDLPRFERGRDAAWYREVHPTHVVEHHRHAVIMSGPNVFRCGYIYGDGAPCVATFFWGGISGSWAMRVYKLEDFKGYQDAMARLQSEHERSVADRLKTPKPTLVMKPEGEPTSRDEMLGLLQPHVD